MPYENNMIWNYLHFDSGRSVKLQNSKIKKYFKMPYENNMIWNYFFYHVLINA